MPKMRKKADLAQKICLRCGLPFSWRKKWERDWDEVRYCSDRCRKGGGVVGAGTQERR
ncbi:MAG TPA: DUF2256 domain-containing protein [Tabrizicola sp.]|nr:DUF2256 domain-containing protein [Tabrizicola sp.]